MTISIAVAVWVNPPFERFTVFSTNSRTLSCGTPADKAEYIDSARSVKATPVRLDISISPSKYLVKSSPLSNVLAFANAVSLLIAIETALLAAAFNAEPSFCIPCVTASETRLALIMSPVLSAASPVSEMPSSRLPMALVMLSAGVVSSAS